VPLDAAANSSPGPPERGRDDSDIRTFLIADVRGYTRFTQEHGDEEAGALAARFAGLARETVEAQGGTLLELRGDEALCVFTSARRALRAAVDLQVRSRASMNGESPFPLGIGIGLDAGEAVPIEGGYRGGALNVAARLCALAGPGQIFASETVVGLAGRLNGVRFSTRRSVRLKGIERPVRLAEVAPVEPLPPLPARVGKRGLSTGWLVTGAVGAIALLGSLVALGISRSSEEKWLDGVRADAVGLIDADAARIADELPVGGGPRSITVGDGSIWVANGLDGTVSRIDPATHDVHTIPVGQSPTAIAFGDGSVWVANDQDRTVSRISPDTNRVVDTIPVGNGPRAVAVGAGAVWVANGVDGTISRIDLNKASGPKTIPVGLNPSGIAVLDDGVWVTSEGTGIVSRVDSASGEIQATITVGHGPSALAAGDGVLWVANAEDATVSRVDPAKEKVTGLVPVGRNPRAVAVGLGAVWVANADAGTVTKIDPETPEVESTIRLVGSPTALTVASGSVWATAVSTPASHRGGTLRIESAGLWECECFDPNVPWNVEPWAFMTTVFDGLVAYKRVGGTEGGTVVPDLATAVPIPTDAGRTYTFRLRPGLRFSNGQPVQASDVRASFERMLRVSWGAVLYHGIAGGADCTEQPARCDLSAGVEADDEAGTVVIHLTEPDPDFLAKLALPFASVLPAESPRRQDTGLPLVGTGPYKLAAFAPDGFRLVRNPNFRVWSRDAQPAGYPDAIEVRFGAGLARQIEDVTSGAADYVVGFSGYGDPLPPERLSELAARYAGQFHSDPIALTQYVFLRTTEAPFDDPRVRRALNYAVDRRAVLDLLGGPLGAQATCQMLAPNLPGYEPYCPYTLDPNPAGTWTAPDFGRASRLVARSGTKGMHVRMVADAPRADIGRYFVSLLRGLGYRASLKVLDLGDFPEYVYGHEQRVQLATTAWLGDYISPANFLQPNFACPSLNGGELNVSEYCNARIDAVMRRAAEAQADNPAGALALWAEADHMVTDAAPAVFLSNPHHVALVSERVGNYQVHPVWGPLLDQLWVK
jgi:YVTN family beta-propeller protein